MPNGQGGWSVYGGTSLSSPLIAAMYGLAGNTGQLASETTSTRTPRSASISSTIAA